jgi:hypothetical protein
MIAAINDPLDGKRRLLASELVSLVSDKIAAGLAAKMMPRVTVLAGQFA